MEFGIDRRAEPRLEVDIRARVKSLDPVTSIGPSTVGRVVEISRHGLKLRVRRPFMIGASLQILAERKMFLAKVRHCSPVEDDYHVGVLLSELDS